jgi:hypothetical protein
MVRELTNPLPHVKKEIPTNGWIRNIVSRFVTEDIG